jgi:hypothetical protein
LLKSFASKLRFFFRPGRHNDDTMDKSQDNNYILPRSRMARQRQGTA